MMNNVFPSTGTKFPMTPMFKVASVLVGLIFAAVVVFMLLTVTGVIHYSGSYSTSYDSKTGSYTQTRTGSFGDN